MKPAVPKPQRCAVYTRKSTEHNLDLEFNSLDAQREACEAYIKSQAHEGWRLIPDHYDDGGLSGASLDRPSLQNLLADVRAGKITVVVVYKVDRLTRSLADFVLPGTVYNFGPDAFPDLRETSPQNPVTAKGRIRAEMERRLREAASTEVGLLIVRAGDFFGPKAGNNWFSQGLVKAGLGGGIEF
jgi:hypothetical protein